MIFDGFNFQTWTFSNRESSNLLRVWQFVANQKLVRRHLTELRALKHHVLTAFQNLNKFCYLRDGLTNGRTNGRTKCHNRAFNILRKALKSNQRKILQGSIQVQSKPYKCFNISKWRRAKYNFQGHEIQGQNWNLTPVCDCLTVTVRLLDWSMNLHEPSQKLAKKTVLQAFFDILNASKPYKFLKRATMWLSLSNSHFRKNK